MKNRENERYVKLGVTGAAVAVIGVASYFLLSGLRGASGLLGQIKSVLAPFLYGAVMAYLVAPLCNRLERGLGRLFRGRRDGLVSALAIAASLLLAVAVVLAVALLVMPQLVRSVAGLVEVLPGQVQAAWSRLQQWLEGRPELLETWTKVADEIRLRFNAWVKNDLPGLAEVVLNGAIGGVTDTVSVIVNLLLGVIISIYLLARRRQLAAQARLLLRGAFRPRVADWLEAEARFADRMFNGFFVGKLLDSLVVGVLCFAGCLAMGFSSPFLIAAIVGVTNMIPFFGQFIGATPCALLLLLENPMHCLMFLIFIVVLMQVDGNVISPRILGNSTGLSGLWVMFAILIFGGFWGIGGMIVGVPMMAVIYDIVRQLTWSGVKRHGGADMLDAYDAEFHPEPPARR